MGHRTSSRQTALSSEATLVSEATRVDQFSAHSPCKRESRATCIDRYWSPGSPPRGDERVLGVAFEHVSQQRIECRMRLVLHPMAGAGRNVEVAVGWNCCSNARRSADRARRWRRARPRTGEPAGKILQAPGKRSGMRDMLPRTRDFTALTLECTRPRIVDVAFLLDHQDAELRRWAARFSSSVGSRRQDCSGCMVGRGTFIPVPPTSTRQCARLPARCAIWAAINPPWRSPRSQSVYLRR